MTEIPGPDLWVNRTRNSVADLLTLLGQEMERSPIPVLGRLALITASRARPTYRLGLVSPEALAEGVKERGEIGRRTPLQTTTQQRIKEEINQTLPEKPLPPAATRAIERRQQLEAQLHKPWG